MQFWEKNFETSVAICFASGFVHSCIFFKAFYVWNSAWVVYRAFVSVINTKWSPLAWTSNVKLLLFKLRWPSKPRRHQNRKMWNQTFLKRDQGWVSERISLFLTFSRSSSSIAGLWFVFWRPSFLSCFIFTSNIWLERTNWGSLVREIPRLLGGELRNLSMPFLLCCNFLPPCYGPRHKIGEDFSSNSVIF